MVRVLKIHQNAINRYLASLLSKTNRNKKITRLFLNIAVFILYARYKCRENKNLRSVHRSQKIN